MLYPTELRARAYILVSYGTVVNADAATVPGNVPASFLATS
jgi:hypothetical protein